MVEFKCIIPDTESAIKIHGSNGMRITLDIPESELAAALYLIELRGAVLKVNIEVDGQERNGSTDARTPKRTKARTRKRQGGTGV